MTKPEDPEDKESGLKLEGEGSYEGARRFQNKQRDFAENSDVEKKARDAARALDNNEGEALEKARKEAAGKRPQAD